MSPETGSGHRFRRTLGILGGAVGLTATFLLAAAGGALIHLDMPASRRAIPSLVNGLLAPSFRGSITVVGVGDIGLGGLGGVRVRVDDPEGRRVLEAGDVRAHFNALDIARSAIAGSGDIVITLDELAVDSADISLDADESGALRLARAFESPHPAPPDPTARGLRLSLRRVELAHAWVHGQMAGAPAVDADIHSLSGSVLVAPEETILTVDHLFVDARAMPRGANPKGAVEARLSLPSGEGARIQAAGAFIGVVGEVPVTARGSLRSDTVDVVADVPATPGDAIRALLPEAPIYDSLSIHAEARGDLPELAAKVRVGLGQGTVEVDGHVALRETIRGEATIHVRALDARALSPDAPPSTLGADVFVAAAARPGGAISGDYILDVLPGDVRGEVIPPAALHGAFTEKTARVAGTIFEPGARTEIAVDLRPQGDSRVIEFAIGARIPDFRRVARVKSLPEGSGRLAATGAIALGEAPRIDARAEADLAGLKVGAQQLSHGRLEARAGGALSDPAIDATFRGEGLRAGGVFFSRADVTARGRAASAVITAALEGEEMRLRATTTLAIGAAVTLRSPQLEVTRGAITAAAKADLVRIDGANLDVENGSIEGLGEPAYATVQRRPAGLAVRAMAADLDLSRLAYLARVERSLRGGHLAFDVDMRVGRAGAQGTVDASLSDVLLPETALRGAQRASGRVEAAIDGRRVRAAVRASIGNLGTIEVDVPGAELAGGPLDPASWRRATGAARAKSDVDLARIAAMFPREDLPFEEMVGRLQIEADVNRPGSDRAPGIRVSARTQRLTLAGKAAAQGSVGGTAVVATPPWRIVGVDASLDAAIDGDTGEATLAAELHDRRGALASVDFGSTLPYAAVYRDPAGAARLLEDVPLRARLSIPRRSLAALPALLQTAGMEGEVEVLVDVRGTALEPAIDLTARGYGVRPSHSPLMSPADAEVLAKYEGARADVGLKVRFPAGEVLSASSTAHISLTDVVARPEGRPLPWDGSADVRLCDFPLKTLAVFGGKPIGGTASGHVTVDDLHRNGRIEARIGLHDLQVGTAKYPDGIITARSNDGVLTASARLNGKDGFAEVTANAGLRWGAEVVPALDEAKPVEARLVAKQFRAAALQPFVASAFNDLDGLINADTKVTLGPGPKTRMQGAIALEKGHFQLADVGEQFRDARAKVTFEERGIIRVNDVFARGPTGSVKAKAVARLNGLAFMGANGWAQIPKSDPLPIVIQGEGFGEASGTFVLTSAMSRDKKTLTMNVDVSALEVRLPDTASHAVQALEPAEHIRIGVYRTPNTLELLPLGPPDDREKPRSGDAMRYRIAVRLRDAEIRRGTDVRVRLAGNPTIEVAEKTSVLGQIRLTGGLLDIQGKQFEIERGTVAFTGDDPANPEIVVTAGWNAPDGTRVYADFIGPLTTGKVTLRSEPSLTQNEILSLIVFGTVDGLNAQPPPGQQADRVTQAVGAGGGIATQGLTRAMDDLTGLDITARVDTSASGNPRPEIEVQIARSISFQFAHVLGIPPPGVAPDKNIATIDWRFRRNWSILTSFGDQGSAMIDLLWHHRY